MKFLVSNNKGADAANIHGSGSKTKHFLFLAVILMYLGVAGCSHTLSHLEGQVGVEKKHKSYK